MAVLVIRRSLGHLEHGELSLVLLLAAGLDHQLVVEAVFHAVATRRSALGFVTRSNLESMNLERLENFYSSASGFRTGLLVLGQFLC